MNGTMGWIVAALVVVVAGAFYFWPTLMQAPTQTETATTTAQSTDTQLTENPDMPGTWRSNEDTKFTREFRADGVVIDRYEGDASAGISGEWTAVDPVAETTLGVPAASLAGKVVIKVVWEGGVETTYFSINSLTDTTMSITDLSSQGGVTTFTRVN